MKRLPKFLVAGLCSSMILAGCGSSAGTTTTSATTESVTSSVNTGTNEKETFFHGTKDYAIDNLTAQVPTEYGQSQVDTELNKRWRISDKNAFGMRVWATSNLDSNDDTIMRELITGNGMATPDESTANEVTPTNVKKFKVGDYDATSFEVAFPYAGSTYNCCLAYVVNTDSKRLDVLILAEDSNARYTYKDDFYKIVKSLKVA